MTTFSEAYLEALAACPPSQREYNTVEINHPSFAEPAYIVANVADDMQFGIEVGTDINSGQTITFQACPFQAEWPEQREGQPPTATIKVDNVGRELIPKIRAAQATRAYITVTLRQYLQTDLTEPAYGPVEFILTSITATGTTLSGTVVVKNLMNKRFPRLNKNYDPVQFPSLLPNQ